MSNKTLQVDDGLYKYLLSASLREAQILTQLRAETANLQEHSMQIAPEQGQFMALLVRLIGARRCIEVGVFTGYSALATAMVLPDDGYLLACDISEDWTAIARRYWQQAGVAGKIDLHIAPALATLDAQIADGQSETFDMAFIDADKVAYSQYYERCLALLRPGGLVLIDNVLWSGDVARADVNDEDTVAIRQFNRFLQADLRVDISMLPLADGLSLARKR